MTITIRVLGCSGGIGGERTHTSSFLVDDDILIDAGTGVTTLSVEAIQKIDHVFVTHAHLDHICSIPFMVDLAGSVRVKPLIVHALKETIETMQKHIFNWQIWPDFTAIPNQEQAFLKFQICAIDELITLDNRQFTVLPANHVIPATGYAVSSDQASFVFTGDTTINKKLWPILNQLPELKHLVIETSFAEREHTLALLSKHLCPSLLAEELAQLAQDPIVHITHLKPGAAEQIMQEIFATIHDRDIQMLQTGQVFSI